MPKGTATPIGERDLAREFQVGFERRHELRRDLRVDDADRDFLVQLERSGVEVRRADVRPDPVDDHRLLMEERAIVFEHAHSRFEHAAHEVVSGMPDERMIGLLARQHETDRDTIANPPLHELDGVVARHEVRILDDHFTLRGRDRDAVEQGDVRDRFPGAAGNDVSPDLAGAFGWRKILLAERQLARFLDPVLGEHRLQRMDDRSDDADGGISKVLSVLRVAAPFLRDAVTEDDADAPVGDEDLSVRAVVPTAKVLRPGPGIDGNPAPGLLHGLEEGRVARVGAESIDEDTHLDAASGPIRQCLTDLTGDLAESPDVRLEMDRVARLGDVLQEDGKEAVTVLQDLDGIAFANRAASDPRDGWELGGDVTDGAPGDDGSAPARARREEPEEKADGNEAPREPERDLGCGNHELKNPVGRFLACALLAVILTPGASLAFSVLAHQEIVDRNWERAIVPLLERRFPGATPEDVRKAHAYAYGGAVVADLGYFPFGDELFSELLHYARSGDFVAALLEAAQDRNGYAFALGHLAHYSADSIGHPEATNRTVAVLFPKLAEEHGEQVTYADSARAHLQTEFRFDVLQVSRLGVRHERFQDGIGFEIDQEVLGEAFRRTYGLELEDLFESVDLAVGTFRWGVRAFLREVTNVAWHLYEDDLKKEHPQLTRGDYVFDLPVEDFERSFGDVYREPSYFGRIAGFFLMLVRLVPGVGTFEKLVFEPLPDEVIALFDEGLDDATKRYTKLVATLAKGRPRPPENVNLDTGRPTARGEYSLADEAHDEWLRHLEEKGFAGVDPKTREALRSFYGELPRRDESGSGR